MEQYVITISRQFGSLGRSIAQELSAILKIDFLDRDLVEAAYTGFPDGTVKRYSFGTSCYCLSFRKL